MNNNEAFKKGTKAFHEGKPRSAYSDPAFNKFTNPGTFGSLNQSHFVNWYKGWDTANLESDKANIAKRIFDPEQEYEESHERWLENLKLDQAHLNDLDAANSVCYTGVEFNKDGSVTLSADWIMRNL